MSKTKLQSTGFGESKQVSTVPMEDFGQNPDDGLPPRQYWTCNGVPVDLMPNANLITWGMTDQAMAERMRVIEAQGGPAAVVSRDKFDKRNDARIDHVLERGGTIHDAPNERKALADAHVQPGFVARFLGGSRLERKGKRGYEIVKDADGNPVTFGNEVLAQIPKPVFDARRRSAKSQSDRQREGLTEKIHDQQKSVYEAAGLDPALIDASRAPGVVREEPY